MYETANRFKLILANTLWDVQMRHCLRFLLYVCKYRISLEEGDNYEGKE